jgi:hypothetical protein
VKHFVAAKGPHFLPARLASSGRACPPTEIEWKFNKTFTPRAPCFDKLRIVRSDTRSERDRMKYGTQRWVARVMSGLAVLFLLFDATIKVLKVPAAVGGTMRLGYSESVIVPLFRGSEGCRGSDEP